jgi:hypothetical protein
LIEKMGTPLAPSSMVTVEIPAEGNGMSVVSATTVVVPVLVAITSTAFATVDAQPV